MYVWYMAYRQSAGMQLFSQSFDFGRLCQPLHLRLIPGFFGLVIACMYSMMYVCTVDTYIHIYIHYIHATLINSFLSCRIRLW